MSKHPPKEAPPSADYPPSVVEAVVMGVAQERADREGRPFTVYHTGAVFYPRPSSEEVAEEWVKVGECRPGGPPPADVPKKKGKNLGNP